MWYDAYKKEQILVQQEDEHNKFWSAVLDEKTNTATIRWGRLGTAGQSQTKNFSSVYEAGRFIDGKLAEKRRKGYKVIDKTKFDKMCVEAAIVGTQNKCHNFAWVEITDEKNLVFAPVNEERLMDPNCNPGIRVDLETKKKYGGRDFFRLLLTYTQVFDIGGSPGFASTQVASPTLVTKSHPLYELTAKVEEAVGRSLSGA